MKCLISGHRLSKLRDYSVEWIKNSIVDICINYPGIVTYGYSGMASGVDLWFCETCFKLSIPYAACIPFDEQATTMAEDERVLRQSLIDTAAHVFRVKNSWMVEHADTGIIVWDGNKGGTHNVFQQMVERKKPFFWLDPVSEKIHNCV